MKSPPPFFDNGFGSPGAVLTLGMPAIPRIPDDELARGVYASATFSNIKKLLDGAVFTVKVTGTYGREWLCVIDDTNDSGCHVHVENGESVTVPFSFAWSFTQAGDYTGSTLKLPGKCYALACGEGSLVASGSSGLYGSIPPNVEGAIHITNTSERDGPDPCINDSSDDSGDGTVTVATYSAGGASSIQIEIWFGKDVTGAVRAAVFGRMYINNRLIILYTGDRDGWRRSSEAGGGPIFVCDGADDQINDGPAGTLLGIDVRYAACELNRTIDCVDTRSTGGGYEKLTYATITIDDFS